MGAHRITKMAKRALDQTGARILLNLCAAGVSNSTAGKLCGEEGAPYSVSTVKRIKRHAKANNGEARDARHRQDAR